MMDIVIKGGLGNQMFQLAHAIVMSKRHAQSLRLLDFTGKSKTKRNWSLDAFGYYPSDPEIRDVVRVYAIAMYLRFFEGIKPSKISNTMAEGSLRNPIAPFHGHITPDFIMGYWQDYRWISDNESLIRDALSFPDLPPNVRGRKDLAVDDQISAIHIRRGDYVSDPKTMANHLTCDIDYYKSAWNHIRRETSCRTAWVFSDDPEWAAYHLKLDAKMIQEECPPDSHSFVDMARMSSCDHFILSNSTYGWWAAFLAKGADKIVVAPEYWLAGVRSADVGLMLPNWLTADRL